MDGNNRASIEGRGVYMLMKRIDTHRQHCEGLLTTFRSRSILAAYIAISTAIVIVAFYYYWEGCRIEQRYGANPNYCTVGGGWTFFSPWTIVLFVPVAVGMFLVFLRVVRGKTCATVQRTAIFTLTTVSEVLLILIILGALFGVALEDDFAGKQCVGYGGQVLPEYQQTCNRAVAIADFSRSLLPIQVVLCVAGIVLTYLYWKYYGRVAPVI